MKGLKLFLIALLGVAQIPSSLCMAKKSKNLLLDVKDVEFVDKSNRTLVGKELDLPVMGADVIVIQDSLLMCVTNDQGGMLKVFSLNSHRLLGGFCHKGRASNEFIQLLPQTTQTYVKNGDIIFPLVESSTYEIREVNVSQSLRKGSTVINGVSQFRFPDTFVLLDNDINRKFINSYYVDTDIEERRDCPVSLYIQNKDDKEYLSVYGSRMKMDDRRDALAPYTGNLYKHPSRNIVLKPHMSMDYLFLFDVDRKQNIAIHQKGALTYDDVLPQQPGVMTNFSCAAVGKDCFFVLYWSTNNNKNKTSKEMLPELMAFDWDGNFLWSATLAQLVASIAYDEKNHIIYGLERSEERIYAFPID